MANDNQAKTAEEQAQPEPVPSSSEKVTEKTDAQEVAPVTEVPSETSADASDEKLPEGVSERTTEQFDKVRQQASDDRERFQREIDQLKNPVKPTQIEKPLYDPKTGLVDIEALEQIRKDATGAKAELDKFKQQTQTQLQNKEQNELFEAHPELKDKETKEAKKLFDESEKIWMHAQAYPEKYGGNPLTQKKAADLAKKLMSNTETPEQEAERLEPKEQAGLSASGKPSQGVQKQTSQENLESLRLGTRMDDKQSIITRMRNIRETQAPQK